MNKLIDIIAWVLAVPMALLSVFFGFFIWVAAKLGLIRK